MKNHYKILCEGRVIKTCKTKDQVNAFLKLNHMIMLCPDGEPMLHPKVDIVPPDPPQPIESMEEHF
jgi:hypothetical protein